MDENTKSWLRGPTSGDHLHRNGSFTLRERAAYSEGLDDAAQRARYLLKHQTFEDDEAGRRYEQGFTTACDVLNDILSDAANTALAKPILISPTSLVEAVARAICSADGMNPDHKAEIERMPSTASYSDPRPAAWTTYVHEAEAALLAAGVERETFSPDQIRLEPIPPDCKISNA